MRITQIIEVINAEAPNLKLNTRPYGNSTDKIAQNLATLRKSVIKLSAVPALQETTTAVLSVLPFIAKNEDIRMSETVSDQIRNSVDHLRQTAVLLSKTLISFGIPNNNETIFFRIPTASNLSTFSSDIEKVSKSLENILALDNNAPSIQFKGFEKGSDWIVLAIASGAFITKLLTVFNIAMSLAERNVRLEKAHLELKQAEADEAILEKSRQMILDTMDAFYNGEAKKVFSAFQQDPTLPENRESFNRVIHSMKNLQSLFSRGASAEVPLLPNTPQSDQQLNAEIEETKKAIENTTKFLLQLTAPTDTV